MHTTTNPALWRRWYANRQAHPGPRPQDVRHQAPTERVFRNGAGRPTREIRGQGWRIHMPASSYSPRQNALSALVCAALAADYAPTKENR
jgi:hypothetical protein